MKDRKRDKFVEGLLLVVLVFMMASIYAVNHEESAIISNQKQKGVAQDGR